MPLPVICLLGFGNNMRIPIPQFDLDSSDDDFREYLRRQGIDYDTLLKEAGQAFAPFKPSNQPCRKCRQLKVLIIEITSNDHGDHMIKCSACGDSYVEEGPDS